MPAHFPPDPLLIATMIDAHRQLDEFVTEGAGPDPFDGIDWGTILAELDAILADAEERAFDECPIAAGSLIIQARQQLRAPCPECAGQTGHTAGTINGPAWLDCPTCDGTGNVVLLGGISECDASYAPCPRGCPEPPEGPPDPDPDLLTAWTPEYSPWRHGGWYVNNVRYPSGAVGCVSRNYPDRKWRISCDRRPGDHTYRNRDEAARAERSLIVADPRCMDGHAIVPGDRFCPECGDRLYRSSAEEES